MKIETKFNVGDEVYFLDTNKVKLIRGIVTSIRFSIDSENKDIEYKISISPYCTTSSELMDELRDWLGGSKDEIYLECSEHLLFKSRDEFLEFITTEEIVIVPTMETEKQQENGDTEKHSEQHKGNEQIVQRRQSDY